MIALREEFVDHFGEFPAQTQALIETHRLRQLLRPWYILKLDAAPKQIANIRKKSGLPTCFLATQKTTP